MSNDTFKTALAAEVNQNAIEQRHQEELSEKYNIEKENVVIVEKSNWGKFIIRIFVHLFRIVASIVIVGLAAIGVITLIYPEIREPFLYIIIIVRDEILGMIGVGS